MNQPKPAFCIFIDTICEGRVPAWHDENQMPVVYPTAEAAQREIADDVIERLEQFLKGERDFDDAMTVEDYILPVDVLPDGSILDEDGNCFGKKRLLKRCLFRPSSVTNSDKHLYPLSVPSVPFC